MEFADADSTNRMPADPHRELIVGGLGVNHRFWRNIRFYLISILCAKIFEQKIKTRKIAVTYVFVYNDNKRKVYIIF